LFVILTDIIIQVIKWMDRSCGHTGRETEMHTGIGRGKLKGDHLEGLGIDRRIVLKCVFKGMGWGCIEWMNLT